MWGRLERGELQIGKRKNALKMKEKQMAILNPKKKISQKRQKKHKNKESKRLNRMLKKGQIWKS